MSDLTNGVDGSAVLGAVAVSVMLTPGGINTTHTHNLMRSVTADVHAPRPPWLASTWLLVRMMGASGTFAPFSKYDVVKRSSPGA